MAFENLTAAGLERVDRDDYVPSPAVTALPDAVDKPVSGTQIGNGPDELLDHPQPEPVDLVAEFNRVNALLP